MELLPTHSMRINDWLGTYAMDLSRYQGADEGIHSAVLARLGDDGLNYHHIQHRVKEADSLGRKLDRRTEDGTPRYANGLEDIDDLIGVRIILFLESDIPAAMEALAGAFEELDHVDKSAEQKARGDFGYSGQHLVLRVPRDNPPAGCENFCGQRFEVQFRTILQHAWAEFEHEIRYKGTGPVPPEVNRAFTLASGLIELADREFDAINHVVALQRLRGEARVAGVQSGDELNAAALREVLEQELPENPRSRAEHYDWLVQVLEANTVYSLSEATALLRSADWTALADRLRYRFPPGHVRAADDYLLEQWGRAYIQRTAHLSEDGTRRGKLEYRLRRLVS
ncbi:hypothetical protein MUK71_14650 [Arthrobacter zhangbolii]|uniref:RelA/SpoT domain-containing protein n=1 Tax=Arthrobacter zhangbolii TaxID=2886936 RepID=A0A9X1S8A6_9MICC|nr:MULTISPECIES: hypothetical protein [Arthrobacter]MCC3272335.1 hypothetical protein [Arthrobacter zhangbolii]MCC3294184.1 hypothetical protein [Arthrobacter zhangbolii]MDN3903400.1 hypothetical protein [Arthrobacter sp. YD2]UON91802.1 hypothetical protein MUK71_14650 [Arthrobacter zhangbolii]